MPWLWEMVEWGNSAVFSMLHCRSLKGIPEVVMARSNGTFRITSGKVSDLEALFSFFEQQPEEAFTFFHPHGFDRKSLQRVMRRNSFQVFLVWDSTEKVVGYGFLRCFVNGTAFKGYMVDCAHRNQGIAKLISKACNDVASRLRLRQFATISPENMASLAATKAICDVRVIKVMENGDYYIECMPKS